MFNLINIGERLGSGVPLIFNTRNNYGWKEPIIEELFDPDRTILLLEFVEKQANKASLSEMKNVEPTGRTTGRKYRLKR